MTREDVIRGLECCLKDDCDNCTYYDPEVDHDCDYFGKCLRGNMYHDVLALLKSQEPVAPKLQSGGNYVCGNCGMYTVGFMHPLTGESVQTWKYCGSCGKAVKWDA